MSTAKMLALIVGLSMLAMSSTALLSRDGWRPPSVEAQATTTSPESVLVP